MSFALGRTAAARLPSRVLARSYATELTQSSAAGVKLASFADPAPTASVSVVVKAGSRYETAPGLAAVLKSSLFKSTEKRSAIRLVRESELFGGVLSTTLSREHLILTAEFLKGDEGFFTEVLGDALTKAKFAAHEYNEEVIPAVASEYEQAIADPATYALDIAHQLAFRTGLGNSLFASPHAAVDYKSAATFAQSAFSTPSNFSVVSTGVDSGALSSLVSEFFVPTSSGGSVSTPKASYYGGEIRVPGAGHSHSPIDHFLVAFKGTPASEVELTVLRHLLGGESSVKWSPGQSPLAKLATPTASAKAFNYGYSDAGLFGIFVSAPTAEVGGVAKSAVEALQTVAKGASDEAVKQAIQKAKFAAASALESRAGKVELLGSEIATSAEELLAKFDKVTPESLKKAAAAALESKPTTVAIGNTHALPYADILGL
ncbi:LuxS/MPP-like metallohydrolase [Meredithblackwellia eburnea MCA 4105]